MLKISKIMQTSWLNSGTREFQRRTDGLSFSNTNLYWPLPSLA